MVQVPHGGQGLQVPLWLERFLRHCRYSRAKKLHCLHPGMITSLFLRDSVSPHGKKKMYWIALYLSSEMSACILTAQGI